MKSTTLLFIMLSAATVRAIPISLPQSHTTIQSKTTVQSTSNTHAPTADDTAERGFWPGPGEDPNRPLPVGPLGRPVEMPGNEMGDCKAWMIGC